jgi:pimeloyl-ACP methyl ester carboxylesterase
MARLGTDEQGSQYGKTFFIGGAGPVGNFVGTTDVPKGLRAAKYRGAIEVFGWQAVIGGTLRDVIDRERNAEQARRLAETIQGYLDQHPDRRVNLIALSAGTGITTWALEALPEGYRVGTVVYLGSALSRAYDLSAALERIDGHLHCFYSAADPLLRYGLPMTGSVDRETAAGEAAGLYGFGTPPGADAETRRRYAQRLRNRPYRRDYAGYGYYGWHADSTSPRFVEKVIAPLLAERLAAR